MKPYFLSSKCVEGRTLTLPAWWVWTQDGIDNDRSRSAECWYFQIIYTILELSYSSLLYDMIVRQSKANIIYNYMEWIELIELQNTNRSLSWEYTYVCIGRILQKNKYNQNFPGQLSTLYTILVRKGFRLLVFHCEYGSIYCYKINLVHLSEQSTQF